MNANDTSASAARGILLAKLCVDIMRILSTSFVT